MIVYLSVMLVCCILLYAMRNDSNKKKPLAIVFGIIWLMLALQEGWGGDYQGYVYHFNEIKPLSFKDVLVDDSHGEVGYKILLWIMPNFHTWFVVTIGIWCFALAFFFYHFVPQKWWFLAILFVFFDRAILMGMVSSFSRMAIANTFLFFVFYLVSKEKNKWLSALLIFGGSFFHRSVLIMAPFIFLSPKRIKLSSSTLIGIFVGLVLLTGLTPSTWTNFVDTIISSLDTFSEYNIYLEDKQQAGFRGLSLLVFFYWIYLLVHYAKNNKYEGYEYFMMKLALVRIAFDLLPAIGLSTRFFYYIDIYFFAGMMCVMNRLPQKDPHRWGIAITLLMMFWYMGYHQYAATEFFKLRWGTYNFFF